MPNHLPPSKQAFNRRTFLQSLPAAAVMTSAIAMAAEPGRSQKAAVIGHTGRGDYGHGMESIFQGRPAIELVALAEPDPQGRAATAKWVGAARAYADYREMLVREQPELVSIAMRHAEPHYEIALAALRAGAHIYCEKPFTTTPEQADVLLAEARQRNLKIAVAHTMRMSTPGVRLQHALKEGIIGQVVEVRAYGKQDARAGGEDMMVLGSHLFDLMRMFLGDPLWCTAQVLWRGRDISPSDGRRVKDDVGLVAGDDIMAQFAFGGGVHASFTSAAALRETVGNWGLELLGSKGTARLNCDLAPSVFLLRPGSWTERGKTESWAPLPASAAAPENTHNSGPVDDWLQSIAHQREPECSGANGAWAVEMVMGVYRAALSGKRTAFPLVDRGHPLSAADPG
jgi:predicted dehydrogenase